MIDNWEKYFEEHPEEIAGRMNCEVLKYICNELKKERDKSWIHDKLKEVKK